MPDAASAVHPVTAFGWRLALPERQLETQRAGDRVGLGKAHVPDAGTSLKAMFRAEAGKVLVILGGLWLTLATYTDVVLAAFFATFVLTVVVFSLAIFVRE